MLGITSVTIVALSLVVYHYSPDLFSNMSDKAADWLQDKALGWFGPPPLNKIDTHHHYVPSFYAKG